MASPFRHVSPLNTLSPLDEKKWKQVLEKNKRKANKGLSIVADEENMRVAAETEWAAINDNLKEYVQV